jgi:TonB family protein
MTAADRDTRKRRLFGALAAAIYAAVWVLLILFVSFRLRQPEEASEGILINFGASETGLGDTDPAVSDQAADIAPASSGQSPDEVLTQDTDPAPQVPPPNNNNRPTEQPPVERPRQPNPRASFPGRTPGSESTSQGTTPGAGNQGNPAGDPAQEGTGTGSSGMSYSLDGRSVVGALPKPDYPVREEGRVVIEIYVDQQGRVTRTVFRSMGSTTTNNSLVAAAQRAAGQARFNVDETAPFPQIGTITYNFRIQQ